jgi:hypothetical protein
MPRRRRPAPAPDVPRSPREERASRPTTCARSCRRGSTTWRANRPLQPARSLSRRLGNHVLLKREDQQPVFSFKLRGAYNKMAHLTPER